MKQWDNIETDELIKALMLLRNETEAKSFLRDLLTDQEIIEFGKRWQVARMLDQQVPYTKIETDTGLSSTTIARISKWLREGTGGYRMMLRRFAENLSSAELTREPQSTTNNDIPPHQHRVATR